MLHRAVVEQDPPQHSKVPQVMAPADVVKRTGIPLLGHLTRVDDRATEIHRNTLRNRRVEVPRPVSTTRLDQLDNGHEARGREGDIEGDAAPGHVLRVEGRVPGQDDAGDAESRGGDEVNGAGDGLAVEGRVLGRHDGGGDQQRDAGVIDAGEALEQRAVRDTVHGVPEAGADEALAGGEKEDGCDDLVGRGGEGEVHRGGVEVEGDGEDDQEPDGVRPDIDELVGDGERRA